MSARSAVGIGRSVVAGTVHSSNSLYGRLRLAPEFSRSLGRAVSPRCQRAQLVVMDFKNSCEDPDLTHAGKPKPVRHPLTDDPFAGASSAETATQEVLFSGGSAAAAAASAPQSRPFLRSTATAVRELVRDLHTRPRAVLHAAVRSAAAYGVPLLLAYYAFQPLTPFWSHYCAPSLVSFWSFYCASLDSHPLLTKIATGIVGTILGDYIAQKVSHQNEVRDAQLHGKPAPSFVFDVVRTSRLVIYGALVGTPVGHAWFQVLDTHIMPEAMKSAQAVLTKMSMDQLLMCPATTALFFLVMRCWEGHPNDAVAYMRGKIWPTLKANYVLWPLAHIINFAFVPPSQRILYCNAVGVIWTIILSTIWSEKTPPAPSSIPTQSGNRGPGPAAGSAAGPLPGGSWGGSQPAWGADMNTEHSSLPQHFHAAFTPGIASRATDVSGSSCGFGGDQHKPLSGGKGVVQAGILANIFMRPAHWDTKSKDA